VSFEEADERGEKPRLSRSGTELLCPDSGQIEEPMGPPSITERCRERGKG